MQGVGIQHLPSRGSEQGVHAQEAVSQLLGRGPSGGEEARSCMVLRDGLFQACSCMLPERSHEVCSGNQSRFALLKSSGMARLYLYCKRKCDKTNYDCFTESALQTSDTMHASNATLPWTRSGDGCMRPQGNELLGMLDGARRKRFRFVLVPSFCVCV